MIVGIAVFSSRCRRWYYYPVLKRMKKLLGGPKPYVVVPLVTAAAEYTLVVSVVPYETVVAMNAVVFPESACLKTLRTC